MCLFSRLFLYTFSVFFCLSALLVSCEEERVTVSEEERKTLDSIIRAAPDMDSLTVLKHQMKQNGNQLGYVIALRETGKRLRNESRFDEALKVHSEGLKLAEDIVDTLEMVQALNNIGTIYRRLGVLNTATDYHYRAWKMSEESTDTTFVGKKNRVVSLNGLGNVYMTLGNYERADSVLRMALEGEKALKSPIGQAINYANLGSIFIQQNNLDSAWVCYRHSMRLNQAAKNTLGISLCHTYFGLLYEKTRRYDKAIDEYNQAFELMKASKDEWHALGTLLSLAGIHIDMGDYAATFGYLRQAEETAKKIKSTEHLAQIYDLYYQVYKRQGNFQKALSCHEQAAMLQDSVVDIKKVNQIQNLSLNIERNRQMQEMDKAERKYESERNARIVGYIIFAVVVILLLALLGMSYYLSRVRAKNHRIQKRLNVMRETFFTNITHEFRTPLTVILGLSKSLQNENVSAKSAQEMGRTIERQGNSMLVLINQLLDISKIKSAIGTPDWRNGDIITYIDMLADSYREFARERNIELQFVADGVVNMDFVPDYINKVMNNLLSNAFKFTPEYGKVSITVTQQKDNVLLTVSDTGIGIDSENLEQIFEPFYQVQSNKHYIGTGVGLALVRQIILSMGGTITVNSTVGRGTTFHITIPLKHGDANYAPVNKPESENVPMVPQETTQLCDSDSTNDDSTRVLIIEDNPDVAAYIGRQLADTYDLFYASDGKKGLEKAEKIIPDLIITDLMMPEIDGLEVCRQIRANELVSHVPIIVITAKITEADRIKGLEAGADAYLCKPFNSDELKIRVKKLLEQRSMLRLKYAQSFEKGTEEGEGLSDEDIHFVSKVIDNVYLLMDSQDLDVNLLASRMCMSSRQLHRKINALTGETPAHYIMQIRMKRARQLLEERPEISIAEVATRCGFNDNSVFTRTFKKMCGVTPTQYAKQGSAL